MKKWIFALIVLLTSQNSAAQSNSDWLERMRDFPKGADLHNHLVGATYAENLLLDGEHDPACFNQDFYFSACPSQYTVQALLKSPELKNKLVEAWSMENFHGTVQERHDHFFECFLRFWPYAQSYSGPILAEIIERAANDNVQTLEVLITPDENASAKLAKTIPGPLKFNEFQHQLELHHINKIVTQARKNIDIMEHQAKQLMKCDQHPKSAACTLPVRYQYIALRAQPPKQVFAQLLLGFKLAQLDHRVVAVNLVMPEDGPVAGRDYDLHMRMFAYLHQQYPRAHITLHAGELTSGIAKPSDMLFHIDHAIQIAHAERIGHGTDIMHETHAENTVKQMASKGIAVETNLTSNETLLDTTPKTHPIYYYLQHHVPIVLSTDDEGVLRTNLTNEYKKAATDYHLDYDTLKQISRNSLSYAFIEGANLWHNPSTLSIQTPCKKDQLGANKPSKSCQTFLKRNLKARLQWQLEAKFQLFEKKGS